MIKGGVLITGYDREDNAVDKSMEANGLNEGITEMLAMLTDGKDVPQAYGKQVYLATILANSQDNSLINAYFSKDIKLFQDFLNDFDKRQTSISSKKLIELSADGNEPIEPKILKGCLEYTLSFCQDMEQLKTERNRLLPIFKLMNGSSRFTDKEFDVKSFFVETFNEKRKELRSKGTQTLGKETLDVLKETGYIDETEIQLKEQQRQIQSQDVNRT